MWLPNVDGHKKHYISLRGVGYTRRGLYEPEAKNCIIPETYRHGPNPLPSVYCAVAFIIQLRNIRFPAGSEKIDFTANFVGGVGIKSPKIHPFGRQVERFDTA